MNSVGRRRWLWAVFFVSGAPGLMAQMAWTRIFAAGLGHEFPALMGVVSAYFAGLALGAAGAGRWGGRWRRPECGYGWLELGCGLWIVATTPFLTAWLGMAQDWMGVGASVGREAAIGFGMPLLVIGPAAAAMGATLPMMERAVAPLEDDRRAVSGLYALNTAGAVVGIAVAMIWLMPGLGFRTTLLVAAGLQWVCGGLVVGMARRWGREGGGVGARGNEDGEAGRRVAGVREGEWLPVVLVAGFLGIGFEVLGIRALAQTTENTVRTFAVVLGSVLVGTVLGAAWDRRHVRRGREWDSASVLGGLGLACGASLWVMAWGGWILAGLKGWMGGLAAEAVLAGMVFLVPSAGMGMVFGRWVQRAGAWEGGVGRAVAWNAVGGAMAAPVLVGGLLPVLGLKWTLVGVASGYFWLVPWRAWLGWRAWVPALFGVLAVAAPSGLRLLELPPGARMEQAWDGRMASVAVIRTSDGERVLRVNNHFQQGGTATAGAARRHAHLPLLLHPGPRRALFLGVGTGITMGAAADYRGLEVDGVELLPEVVEALPWFEPENRAPQRREGFRIRIADARRSVRTEARQYDVVVADLFHPAEDGAGMLYTREHFQAIRDRLAPGGLFCQWLPLHQLDLQGVRDVGATFLDVFPEASLWLLRSNVDVPVVGWIGGRERWWVDPEALGRRMQEAGLAASLKPVALGDPVRLLGCRLADGQSVRRWAQGGAIATDDLPRVMFGASRAVYEEGQAPHTRLVALLESVDPGFSNLLPPGTPAEWVARLDAFRGARDLHLRGLGKERDGRMTEALECYLASAAGSADYTAGYAQAVVVASAYVKENPELAKSVLRRLVGVRPEQGLARELLERL